MTIEDLMAENAQVMAQLASNGADFTRKARIEFAVDFPNRELADQACAAVVSAGFLPNGITPTVQSFDPDDPGDDSHDCAFSIDMLPDLDKITEIEFQLRQISDPLGGGDTTWGFLQDDVH